jgi:chorismate mutase
MTSDELSRLRANVDHIDNQIAELLNKRFEIVVQMGIFKKKNSLPLRDLKREREILTRIAQFTVQENAILSRNALKIIFEKIFDVSLQAQQEYCKSQSPDNSK